MLKIITDSASDMPQYIVERFNLHVIPTPVVIDGVDYLDGATIHTKEFYEIFHLNPYKIMRNIFPILSSHTEKMNRI